MAVGFIKEISSSKGYGFITDESTGMLVRFNVSEITEDLDIEEKICFIVIDLDPGKMAINLKNVRSYE